MQLLPTKWRIEFSVTDVLRRIGSSSGLLIFIKNIHHSQRLKVGRTASEVHTLPCHNFLSFSLSVYHTLIPIIVLYYDCSGHLERL
jgi:hypothetical protein